MQTELLAPAGNYAKFLTALYFGADAVYLGGKNFSLRTFADNFTKEEMESAVQYAHKLNKKVYVTANIFLNTRKGIVSTLCFVLPFAISKKIFVTSCLLKQ